MPRASAKHKNQPQEAEVRLYKQWSMAVTPVSIYTVKIIDDIFKTVKRAVTYKINSETGKDQRLSSYDEKIYRFYRELMDVYHGLAEAFYTGNAFPENGETKSGDIWSGIFAVIQSRVKLFEESTAQLGGFLSDANPVVIEKKEIVTKAIKEFHGSLRDIEQRFKIKERKRLILRAVKNMVYDGDCGDNDSIFNNALEQIRQNCFEEIYGGYCSTVRSAVMSLNDLYKRRDTHYYYELLMEEQQILSSIINIQLAALEKELPPDLAENVLNGPVAILKQAHEQLNFKVEEIKLLFKSTDDNNEPVEDYERFFRDITDRLLENRNNISKRQAVINAENAFKSNYSLFLKSLRDLSDKNMQKGIGQTGIKANLYQCSKVVFEHEQLIEEIIGEFAKISDFYEKNAGLYEGNEHVEIIRGISETVAVKIESLKESKETFQKQMTKLLSDFSAAKLELPENERLQHFNNLKEQLLERLLEALNNDKRGQAVIKEICSNFPPGGLIEEYNGRVARLCRKNLETLNNRLFIFKRDNLLFEISTFEEILNYSVFVLRQSTDGYIIDFVKNIDDNAKNLMSILAKYNIQAIKPSPHEPFNGKEHDVLMAETNEEFKKGEIIKVMNCGYRQDGVVILRANVIAAK